MFNKFRDYFVQNVLQNYNAYFEERANNRLGENHQLRLALQSAASLYHLREHLPDNLQQSRKEIQNQCTDYGLLGDLVNVSKHRKIVKCSFIVRGRTKSTY